MGARSTALRIASLTFATVAIGAALSGCERPVVGRNFQGASVTGLTVAPEHVRAGVPITIRFRLDGGPQGTVTYTIGGKDFECAPERLGDGSFECVHDGLSRQEYAQGPTVLRLTAKDRVGKTSDATATITLDFECPQVVSLAIDPPIGTPGSTATLTIEANELLAEPPIVSRAGELWETASGSGTTYTVLHPITADDETASTDVVVRITDLAGNTSGDCGIDGRVAFGVDRASPEITPALVELVRDIPGEPAMLGAEPGAFTDDVAVVEVLVYEEDDRGALTEIASLVPRDDGSLPVTLLGFEPTGRTRVRAVDVAGKQSDAVLVRERWRLSVGEGAAPNAAIRTAVRYSAAPPASSSMENRTRALALPIFEADTESAVVTAEVGFRTIGQLPSSYRDTALMASGYDPKSRAIVAFGGRVRDVDGQRGETLVLRWNELTTRYESEVVAEQPGVTPDARAAVKLAFDGSGCGVMFGGERTDRWLADTWRICVTDTGVEWTRIDVDGGPDGRMAPILWDPVLRRYVISSGWRYYAQVDLWALDPGLDGAPWQWVEVRGLAERIIDSARFWHAFYYEPRVRGYGVALGLTAPYYHDADFWSVVDGQWTRSSIPFELAGRVGAGFDYDTARSMLVVWGDGADWLARENEIPVLDPDTWLLAGDPRTGAQAWRRTNLAPSMARGFPSLVYDADREASIVFGGSRLVTSDSVAPVIEEMIVAPSYPYLQATLDLATARPRGVEALELVVRANGSGDGDGVGPGTAHSGGVRVLLWDHEARQWDEVRSVDTPLAGAPVSITVSITDRPERYVGLDGVVPVTVVSRWPATDDVDARLEVDLVGGDLVLASSLPGGARVEGFFAEPAIVERGEPVTLTWSVSNAPGGVELSADGAPVLTSTASRGTYAMTIDASTTFTLRAKNTADGDATAEQLVGVRPREAPPLVRSFEPTRKIAPRASLLRLTWEVERASIVRVLRGRTEIFASSQMANAGYHDALLPADPTVTSTVFTLEAKSDAGRELRRIEVRLAHETVLRGPGTSYTWSDGISTIAESDFFVLELAAPGYVDASLFVPDVASGCVGDVDTYLTLLDGNGDSISGTYYGYNGACAHLDPSSNRYLLVPAGTYYLQAQEYYDEALIPAYELAVTLDPVECGNGIKELGEACDDGNRTDGDGCSSTCTFEVDGTYRAPDDGRVTFPGAISPAGTVLVYLVDVSATAYVSIETFVPTSGVCTGADTLLELLAEDGATQLFRDDDGGLGACSRIGALLAPGTYFAAVHDYGDNGVIPAIETVFDVVPDLAAETEPNDTRTTANDLGVVTPGTATATLAASIEPAGDDDWFSFTLPATANVTISIFTSPFDQTACSSADTVMTLFDANGTELASNDDANGTCSVLDGIGGTDTALVAMPAGTYFVQLIDYGDNGTIPMYLIDVRAQ
ncbi:pre-peptidase C-terminal domain-containing protein [Myxococcota bacterium]|nr:pre-peptidase C-terminal domain-containing protein [Myxococcota bacterium]